MCCDVVATTEKTRTVTVTLVPTADSGNEANTQFKPVIGSVLSGSQFFGAGAGFVKITQLRVRERAGSALKRNALLILLYDDSGSPTTPTIDNVYAASNSGLLAGFKINAGSAAAATPFQGYRDFSALIAEAIIQPNQRVKNGSTTQTGCKIVVLFDAAGTVYSAGADNIDIEFTVEDLASC